MAHISEYVNISSRLAKYDKYQYQFTITVGGEDAIKNFNCKSVTMRLYGQPQQILLNKMKKLSIPLKTRPNKYTLEERIKIVKHVLKVNPKCVKLKGKVSNDANASKEIKSIPKSPVTLKSKISVEATSISSGYIIYSGRYFLVQITNRIVNLISMDGNTTHNVKISRGFKSIADDINKHYSIVLQKGISWFPKSEYNYVVEAK